MFKLSNAALTGRAGKAQAPGRPGSVQQPGSGARRREQDAERSERRIPGDEVARNVSIVPRTSAARELA